MVGIKDVAREAEVSVSTVSRALSGKAYVDPDKKNAIMAAVKKLNYKPSLAARSLKSKSTGLIGLIIPDIMNPYYPQVVKHLEDCAAKAGYALILCDSLEDISREEKYFANLSSLFVDGILYIAATDSVDIAQKYMGSIPMVLINRTFDVPVPCIDIDNADAACQGLSYLIDRGHRNVALFMNDTNCQYNEGRLNGCNRAIDSRKNIECKLHIVKGVQNEEIAFKKTVKLFSGQDRPTAIFCFNDYMAAGIYKGLYEIGLKIPKDVSVVGFDDIPSVKYLNPPLTSIRHSLYDNADYIFGLIIKQINEQRCDLSGIKKYFKGQLIVRESVTECNKS